MRIGLIDVDGHASKKKWGATIYPNIALAKIARFHKELGDEVEWYSPLGSITSKSATTAYTTGGISYRSSARCTAATVYMPTHSHTETLTTHTGQYHNGKRIWQAG